MAQQQYVGPLQTPLAGVTVVALSHQELTGAATALGEQPVKSLLVCKVAARLAVSEALTNLVFALVTDLRVSPQLSSCSSVLLYLSVPLPLSCYLLSISPMPSASFSLSNAVSMSLLCPDPCS